MKTHVKLSHAGDLIMTFSRLYPTDTSPFFADYYCEPAEHKFHTYFSSSVPSLHAVCDSPVGILRTWWEPWEMEDMVEVD